MRPLPRWFLLLVPGLFQLKHKGAGEGLLYLVAAFAPIPFAWLISIFFLIPTAITYLANLQEVPSRKEERGSPPPTHGRAPR
jgi:hypothetical protein